MKRLTRVERRGSELDTTELPPSDILLDWRLFNSDFKSLNHKVNEVAAIMAENKNQRIDLRPYIVLNPYICTTTDKFQKILDIYRSMHLKQICVINPVNGSL